MTGTPKRYIVLDKGSYVWSHEVFGDDKTHMKFVGRTEPHYVATNNASGFQLSTDIQQAQVFSDGDSPRNKATKKKFTDRPEEYTVLPVVIMTQELMADTFTALLTSPGFQEALADAISE